jgi:DNA polymerase-3 subunit delta'
MPGGLLIRGAAGIGKLDIALNFAQATLCDAPLATGLPCQKCSACHWFAQGSHPDFRLVQPEALDDDDEVRDSKKKPSKLISVEQIRGLAQFSSLSAHCGGYRVVLIHPAETMNVNASNALLKMLEEPTDKLIFILVTHKPQQLLPTILSRCLSIAASAPSAAEGVAWLQTQHIEHAADALAQAGFAPLNALRGSEDGADEQARRDLLQALSQPAQFDPLALADQLQRTPPVQVVHGLQQWCHDLISAKLAGEVRYNLAQGEQIKKIASKSPLPALLQYQKTLLTAKREATHPLNPKLFFEGILCGYARMF